MTIPLSVYFGGAATARTSAAATLDAYDGVGVYQAFEFTGPGGKVRLPDARTIPAHKYGRPVFFIANTSTTETFELVDNDGTTLETIGTEEGCKVHISEGDTAAGTWVRLCGTISTTIAVPPSTFLNTVHGVSTNAGSTQDVYEYDHTVDTWDSSIPTGGHSTGTTARNWGGGVVASVVHAGSSPAAAPCPFSELDNTNTWAVLASLSSGNGVDSSYDVQKGTDGQAVGVGNILITMGYLKTGGPVLPRRDQQTLRYNLSTDTHADEGATKAVRCHSGNAGHLDDNSKLYVTNGDSGGTSSNSDRDLEEYTELTMTWSTLSAYTLSGSTKHGLASVEDVLYKFGGLASGSPINGHERYVTATDTWDAGVQNMPASLQGHYGREADGRIFS